MDGGRLCAPSGDECPSDILSVPIADSPSDDASRRSRRQLDAHRVLDQATSADDVPRMTNSEADEYVEALLSWLLEREISGQVEADRLRSLNDEFRQFSRDDRQITDCAFFKAISRAGIPRKDRRVARSDPPLTRGCVSRPRRQRSWSIRCRRSQSCLRTTCARQSLQAQGNKARARSIGRLSFCAFPQGAIVPICHQESSVTETTMHERRIVREGTREVPERAPAEGVRTDEAGRDTAKPSRGRRSAGTRVC